MAGKKLIAVLAATSFLGGGPALAQGYAPPASASPTGVETTTRSASPIEPSQESLNAAREQQSARSNERGKKLADRIRPATEDEVVAGSPVHDKKGVPVGTIESLQPGGAVVATAVGKVMVPVEAFGKKGDGLLLDTTKAEFDAIVANANAQPAG